MGFGIRVGRRLFRYIGLAIAMHSLVAFSAHSEVLSNAFLGKFRGTVSGSVGELDGDFNLVSQEGRGGFLMTWPPSRNADFEPTDNPKVFHAAMRGRMMDGASALWARLDDGKLIVYSMEINEHGGYDIYSYMYEPADDGLDLTVRHLRSGSTPMESKGRLKRYEQ